MVDNLQDLLAGDDALHSTHAANENDNMRPEKKQKPEGRQWDLGPH